MRGTKLLLCDHICSQLIAMHSSGLRRGSQGFVTLQTCAQRIMRKPGKTYTIEGESCIGVCGIALSVCIEADLKGRRSDHEWIGQALHMENAWGNCGGVHVSQRPAANCLTCLPILQPLFRWRQGPGHAATAVKLYVMSGCFNRACASWISDYKAHVCERWSRSSHQHMRWSRSAGAAIKLTCQEWFRNHVCVLGIASCAFNFGCSSGVRGFFNQSAESYAGGYSVTHLPLTDH